MNDEVAPAYTIVDFDARYDLTSLVGLRDVYVQLNVTNLLEEDYLGNISTGNNATPISVSSDPRVPLFTGSSPCRSGSAGAGVPVGGTSNVCSA